MSSGSFYVPDGDLYISTELTRGPWSADHQHAGPPSALIARSIERLDGGEGKRIAQIAIDLLHPVPIRPLSVEAEVLRPGKNVDLCRAVVRNDDKPLMVAHAWRYRRAQVKLDIEIEEHAPPPPEEGRDQPFFPTGHDIGYHTAMEWKFLSGAFTEPGDASVWMRMRFPLIPGEDASPAQRVLCICDSASGVSARLHTGAHLFVNTDLSCALQREPVGDWIHLDASTSLTHEGAGTTTAEISDLQGPVGSSLQSLFVRPR